MTTNGNQLFLTVQALVKKLFERELVNLNNRENAVLAKHLARGGSPDGFRHLGVIYSHLAGHARTMGNYGRLDISLHGEMGSILTARKVLDYDQDRIRQAFTIVLRDCKNWQDVRDALPNAAQDLLPEIQRLERTRPEAWAIQDNPRVYAQYRSLREKVEFYAAARLIY